MNKNLSEINLKPWSSIPEQFQEAPWHCYTCAAILGSSQRLLEYPKALEISQNSSCLQDLVPELLSHLPL